MGRTGFKFGQTFVDAIDAFGGTLRFDVDQLQFAAGDLRVDAAYPRDDLFRTSAEYAHLCRVASETLKKAIAG